MIEVICARCKKTFFAWPSKIKKGLSIYCSKSCARGNPPIKRKCKTCGKDFLAGASSANRRGYFCSKLCFTNKPSNKKDKKCEYCGKSFRVILGEFARGGGRFCSRRCFGLAETGTGHQNWQGGKSFEPYCHKFNKEFKERVRMRFNRTCFVCAAPENGRLHPVHHIDYNKNSICNGHGWSFVPLCMRHHSQSNYNRWYWFSLLINYWAMNEDINFEGGSNYIQPDYLERALTDRRTKTRSAQPCRDSARRSHQLHGCFSTRLFFDKRG